MHDTLESQASPASGTGQPFNLDLFNLRAEQCGALTDIQKADLCGISRSTLNRIRDGAVVPKLTTAQRIAASLDLTVAQLWPSEGVEPR